MNRPSIASDRPRPQSLTDLFLSFTVLALQGFGGVLAIVQYELVERKRWLSQEEFVEEWAVAQIMPGPNVVTISMMIGARYFCLRVALAALAGMLAFPTIVLMVLALLYGHFANHAGVAGALRGMGAVASGLIMASGFKLASALRKNPMGMPWCIALASLSFVAVALLRVPLIYVLVPLGSIGCVVAYRRLKP